MFRKFSLFDSSPPPAKISIAPPRTDSGKAQRKSSIKCAIISTLQLQNSPEFSYAFFSSKQPAKRSKSLDHSNDKKHQIHPIQYERSLSQISPISTVLPSMIRELPQPPPTTTHRWFSKFGNSLKKNCCHGGGFQYHVNIFNPSGNSRFYSQNFLSHLKTIKNFISEKIIPTVIVFLTMIH